MAKEYLILEAYQNEWIGAYQNKSEAVKEIKALREEDADGDYYLYEAIEI